MYNPGRMMLRRAALPRTLALVLPIAIFGSFLGCLWTCSEAPEELLDHSVPIVEAACSEDCGIKYTPSALPAKERHDPQPGANSAQLPGATSKNDVRSVTASVPIIPVSTKHRPPERLCVFRI